MTEFGISDHSPWMIENPGTQSCMRWEELSDYVADVQRLQQRYNRDGDQPFRVRLGLEADFVPSRLAAAREVFDRYPWDYIIGSVHHVGLWCVPMSSEAWRFKEHRVEDLCELYFELVRQMIDARFCDVIGHIDLPKKHGHRPEGGFLPYIEPLIPAMLETGVAVEINTSGRDHKIGEVHPDWDVLEGLIAAGVPLQVNSDAHKPIHVGRYFDETLDRLRQLGLQSLVRFEGRRMIRVPLEGPIRIP